MDRCQQCARIDRSRCRQLPQSAAGTSTCVPEPSADGDTDRREPRRCHLVPQNGSRKTIQIIFWEYQFKESANPTNVTRRQFLCSARINPDKAKDLQVFSLSGPSNVVNVKSLTKGSASQFEEGVVVNRVEFTDGTFWQRKGWDVNELRLIPKARSETSNMPACRSL